MFEWKIDDEIVLAALEALERTLQCGQKDWERNRFADYFTKAGALGLLERLRDTGRFKQKAGGILSQYLYVEVKQCPPLSSPSRRKHWSFGRRGASSLQAKTLRLPSNRSPCPLTAFRTPTPKSRQPFAVGRTASFSWFELGARLTCSQQRYDEAIADCNYALRLNPKFAKALYWRSSVFSALNKIKVAQQSNYLGG